MVVKKQIQYSVGWISIALSLTTSTVLAQTSIDITASLNKAYPISNELVGVFFEDINFAADGGLYAELIQNRSFDYTSMDREDWGPLTAWSQVTNSQRKAVLNWDMSDPLNGNNPTYAMMLIGEGNGYAGIENTGFNGIYVEKGKKYNFSLFARMLSNEPGPLLIQLVEDDVVIADATTDSLTQNWGKYEVVLSAKKTVTDAKLRILSNHSGYHAIDMVSLFPQDTYKKRPNGLRKDLVEAIHAINPKFIRFPGGCLVHGDGIDNMYQWKRTIGPIEQRKAQRNIWSYHQTNGLGYYEYFQLAEDLGATPIPILPAAVTCQNSGARINGFNGKGQMCVMVDNMPEFIQDVLDLIEWANGPATSEWGKQRAEAGHPEPFNLKYIGIGNEDVISEEFKVRFQAIYNAVKRKHPEITVIGTSGPFPQGVDYEAGWSFATELNVPVIDEHMYSPPEWFWNNLSRYDSYDRNKSAVYVGEWAAHADDRSSNVEVALAEAAYLTSLERNGDIVKLSSYAPLLANVKNTMWAPDLIYFDTQSVKLSPSYHVQKIFGQHPISEFIPYHSNNSNLKVAYSFGKADKQVIVRFVNGEASSVPVALHFDGIEGEQTASVVTLQGKALKQLSFEHSSEKIEKFNMSNQQIDLPAYSVTNITIELDSKIKL